MASIDVLRGGAEVALSVRLMRPNSLVAHHLDGADPSYLVVAGVVFTAATEPYLESEYGGDYGREAPVKLLDRLLHGHKRSADEQVVVVSQVLACDATLGYEDTFNTQVHAFNGAPVRNLRHLAEMVLECGEAYMRFDVEYQASFCRAVCGETVQRCGGGEERSVLRVKKGAWVCVLGRIRPGERALSGAPPPWCCRS